MSLRRIPPLDSRWISLMESLCAIANFETCCEQIPVCAISECVVLEFFTWQEEHFLGEGERQMKELTNLHTST